MKYLLSLKKKIVIDATTQVNLVDMMLSEKSHTPKDKCTVMSFVSGTYNSQIQRSTVEWSCQRLGEAGKGCCLMGAEFQFCEM